MKKYKIIYLISTGLLTLVMLFSAGNYFFQTTMVYEAFAALGYPEYLVIPLGLAKLFGLAAIWFVPNQSLKEWAYAGFFFDVVLAFLAHVMVSDGLFPGALMAFVFLMTSYFSRKKYVEISA